MGVYRLYVDESGDHGYNDLDIVGGQYLAITGLIIEMESYRATFHPDLEAFKQSTIPHDPDRPLILHRRDIIDRSGVYKSLQNSEVRRRFNAELIQFIDRHEYWIITVVLDKRAHIEKYGAAAFHPYNYCLNLLMERYCGWLRFRSSKGDVLAESRGKREDTDLKGAFHTLLSGGTQFREAGFFRDVITRNELVTAKKESNISGLQVADLLTYPSKQDVLVEHGRIEPPPGEFRDKLRMAMRHHYNRQVYQERIKGYGMILL